MLPEKITPYYRSLIRENDPSDPLARMVIFTDQESQTHPGECDDPIGDRTHARAANGRLIHRYRDRVLILVTDRCAAHCRFCFRRTVPGTRPPDITDQEIEEAMRYIALHENIHEVILSGGDPLALSNSRLLEIMDGLKSMAGERAIRIHTRFPVYDPERCNGFSTVASIVDTMVVHVNHPREITPAFCAAAAILKEASFLLNQSVLLKGVNDSREVLESLSRGLASAGILPYYLHYPDLAQGISHFRIPLEDAIGLVGSLQGRLPGYLIPRLVLDIPSGKGKVVLSGSQLSDRSDGTHRFISPLSGMVADYRDGL